MYYVYLLRDKGTGLVYKGFTSDLKKRLAGHKRGDTKSTAQGNYMLIWYSVFSSKIRALQFEQYLKTASGTAFMRKRLI